MSEDNNKGPGSYEYFFDINVKGKSLYSKVYVILKFAGRLEF